MALRTDRLDAERSRTYSGLHDIIRCVSDSLPGDALVMLGNYAVAAHILDDDGLPLARLTDALPISHPAVGDLLTGLPLAGWRRVHGWTSEVAETTFV